MKNVALETNNVNPDLVSVEIIFENLYSDNTEKIYYVAWEEMEGKKHFNRNQISSISDGGILKIKIEKTIIRM